MRVILQNVVATAWMVAETWCVLKFQKINSGRPPSCFFVFENLLTGGG